MIEHKAKGRILNFLVEHQMTFMDIQHKHGEHLKQFCTLVNIGNNTQQKRNSKRILLHVVSNVPAVKPKLNCPLLLRNPSLHGAPLEVRGIISKNGHKQGVYFPTQVCLINNLKKTLLNIIV